MHYYILRLLFLYVYVIIFKCPLQSQYALKLVVNMLPTFPCKKGTKSHKHYVILTHGIIVALSAIRRKSLFL